MEIIYQEVQSRSLNIESCDHLLIGLLIPEYYRNADVDPEEILSTDYRQVFFLFERARLPWRQTSSLLFLTMLEFK